MTTYRTAAFAAVSTVALLALGKSAALAGALLAGGYLVFALLSLGATVASTSAMSVSSQRWSVAGPHINQARPTPTAIT